MTSRFGYLLLGLLACLLTGADWLQFRGPNGASYSSDLQIPTTWSEDENIAWKVALPGRGPSSPIVVDGKVFVTCSAGMRQDRLFVVAIDAISGDEIWRREFWATGRTLCHPFSAVAAPTPASDGERIVAFYSSNDLVCLDLDGNLQWYRGLAFDYPKAGNDAGMASSPAVAGDTVIVQIENQGDSFAAGIDIRTGQTRWRKNRDRIANWSSPIVLPKTGDGRDAVLLQSRNGLAAYEVRTGEELWRMDASCHSTASAIATPNRIFVPANGLTMLELSGESKPPALAWDSNRLNSSAASPILAGDYVYVINGAGVLNCADAQTGKNLWQLRIGGRHWSTPVVAGDRMVCINQDGQARVVQLGRRGKVLGTNEFGEAILGSPAVAEGALFVRSDEHLWKIYGQ